MKKPIVEIAKNAGACYGVIRACKMARQCAAQTKRGVCHTLGPLIHNPLVVEDLRRLGIIPAHSLDEAESGTLILRSHGTAPQLVKEAYARGFNVVDATCPYVAKVQKTAAKLAQDGYAVLIIGEDGHAEVESIRAAGGASVIAVVDTPEALPHKLPGRLGVVVQTTQSQIRVDTILKVLHERGCELRVEQTRCFATCQRQDSAASIARRADLVFVIGGHNSGNTRRLAEICSSLCANTHHIERVEEIEHSWLIGVNHIGITAGASTPQEQIDEVYAAILRAYED